MKSSELDKLVMLLSSDWFLPHWYLIGIFTDEGKKCLLHDGCREIVRQVMSGAKQYWDVDFASDRVRKTRLMLDALMERCKLEEGALNRIKGLVSGEESSIDDATRWLLVSMTEQLLDGSVTDGPRLNASIKKSLYEKWKHPDEIDFKELCLASTINWDQYLRSTTSDLPAMLADYVSAVVGQSLSLIHI